MDRMGIGFEDLIRRNAEAIRNYLSLDTQNFAQDDQYGTTKNVQEEVSPSFERYGSWPLGGLLVGPGMVGRHKPTNPPFLDPKIIDDEIQRSEEIHRKAEETGFRYDFQKCNEVYAQEVGRCYRRWQQDPVLSVVYPNALAECLQRARERYDYCKIHKKMPRHSPEYGSMEASGQPRGKEDPDRVHPDPAPTPRPEKGDEGKPSEFGMDHTFTNPTALALTMPLLIQRYLSRPEVAPMVQDGAQSFLKAITVPPSVYANGMPPSAAAYLPPPWLPLILGAP